MTKIALQVERLEARDTPAGWPGLHPALQGYFSIPGASAATPAYSVVLPAQSIAQTPYYFGKGRVTLADSILAYHQQHYGNYTTPYKTFLGEDLSRALQLKPHVGIWNSLSSVNWQLGLQRNFASQLGSTINLGAYSGLLASNIDYQRAVTQLFAARAW